MITVVLRQFFSLTVAGAVSGLCKQQTTRTDFPFHRAAKGDDGTLSKLHHVSDREQRCQEGFVWRILSWLESGRTTAEMNKSLAK
jgi:hypothetical protein